ncbi:MAG: ABC transporter permease [Gammaproteobacteria bacterium]|nr:ABC transporter permease [Gammaproteobacteria bacterium]
MPRARLISLALVLPLLAFVGVTFVAPLASLLSKSAYETRVHDVIPETMSVLDTWDGQGLPPEAAFATIAKELPSARADRTLLRLSGAANRLRPGMRIFIAATAQRVRRAEFAGTWRETLAAIDEGWADPQTWRVIKQAATKFSLRHYLQALDLEQRPDGSIGARPEQERVYMPLLWRTLVVSFFVTLLCFVIGYPIAMLIADSPPRRRNLLLLLVLVPFWTSLLVRTTAWIVLLQRQGVINDVLVSFGLLGDDTRLEMIYNMTGTFVAMTHVLLPFMVLPLYSVMRSIPENQLRASASLGASPMQGFVRVYFPQTLPGVGAGALLVFILSIGYYITPALVGGSSGQLISNMIAYHVQTSLNWGLAAALSSILLAAIIVLYLAFNRLVGIDRMRLG